MTDDLAQMLADAKAAEAERRLLLIDPPSAIALIERLDRAEVALAFAKSVILSGEPWTTTCEEVIGAALPAEEK